MCLPVLVLSTHFFNNKRGKGAKKIKTKRMTHQRKTGKTQSKIVGTERTQGQEAELGLTGKAKPWPFSSSPTAAFFLPGPSSAGALSQESREWG